MTSAAFEVHSLPTVRTVVDHTREMIRVDANTARVAIICATVLACVAILGIVAVAVLGSDVAAVSAAIAATIGVLGKLALSFRRNGKTPEET